MNCLGIAFKKNCDLKMQKNAFSNSRQGGAFLKTQNFKRLTCDFTKRLSAFSKIFFQIAYFKIALFLKLQTQTDPHFSMTLISPLVLLTSLNEMYLYTFFLYLLQETPK
jgi:hypothetical protein